MSTSIQLYTLLEKTSSFFSFFKFATESKKYLGVRFDAYPDYKQKRATKSVFLDMPKNSIIIQKKGKARKNGFALW